ncbi:MULTISPECIES: hypothetical protein [Lactobacillus]|uniref:hypothetical protein n=1 Tax=Lactobacillus TaxID=1578 RepID=UPI0022E7FFF8|nr:hypothetical protein [Lactobacillus delbrueckii]
MWLLVALDDRALKYDEAYKIHYVDGQPAAEYYFDEKTAQALEDDGFLTEMWDKFDAMFDWGDFDFFEPDKCVKFREWLLDRMKQPMNDTVRPVYEKMLEFANLAIKCNTGIAFDF